MHLALSRTIAPLLTVYAVYFFYTLHVALPVYANSSFLATLAPERFVGLIYGGASLLTIVALIAVPKILRLVGDYFTTVFFIVFEIAALIGIAALESPALIIALFIVSQALISLISFDFDLIVEKFTKNASTGSIRGLYLTSANIAWIIAPATAGLLLAGEQYWRIYLVAAALLVPGLLIFARRLEHFRDPLYRTVHFKQTLFAIWRSRNLRSIFGTTFLLQFFFTLMVIYTPIYLHDHIGFEWTQLGPIFSIMLIPFLLLEAPLGRLADKVLGEKEMLTAGFIIMAGATAAMYLGSAPSFLLWAFILFMTRVGAAMVEAMNETYFFKKVDGSDASIVSLNRTVRPLASLVSPLLASLFLMVLPFQSLFLALGALMLLGIPFALTLKDTR